MHPLADYHHFKSSEIDPDDRVTLCERHVIDMLLASSLTEDQRESSVAFELKHHACVGQFSRLLARKRGMPHSSCAVGGLLHDIYVIAHGTYGDHAHLGAPIAHSILEEVGGFSDTEHDEVHRIVFNHSDKHVWTGDPFVEFGKDVDVLDCFLYPGALDYYLRHKPLPIFQHYLDRATKVWGELGVPADPCFALLHDYRQDDWLSLHLQTTRSAACVTLDVLLFLTSLGPYSTACPPPFAVWLSEDDARFATNRDSWDLYRKGLNAARDDDQILHELPEDAWHSLLASVACVNGDRLADVRAWRPPKLQADSLLGRRHEPSGLLFWPALDTYEPIRSGDRLASLGFSNQITEGPGT